MTLIAGQLTRGRGIGFREHGGGSTMARCWIYRALPRLPRTRAAALTGRQPVLRRVPMDVNQLGADFMVCAGYKWLLGPFGTGFLLARASI